MRKRQRPLRERAGEIRAELNKLGIPLHALMRSAENYFSQMACENVMQRDLKKYFPMPEDISCTDHFVLKPSRYRIIRRLRRFVAVLGWPNHSFSIKTLTDKSLPLVWRSPHGRNPHRAMVDRYCVGAHNSRLKTGGLALAEMNFQAVWDEAAV
jgi:hypothetical protein